MRRYALLVFCLFSLAAGSLYAERFRFKYTQDEKYRLVTEVEENVYINGSLSHRAEILNKIAVDTLKVKSGAGLLSTTFQVSERAHGTGGSFALTENYHSTYWRDNRGAYDIGPEYFMPVVRNVPLFPLEEIEAGSSWTADGEEVHDFRRNFGIQKPLRFPIKVHYTYLRSEEREGRRLGVLKIQYTVFHDLGAEYGGNGIVPVKITGRSDQAYYWDFEGGKPLSYEERFDFIFHLSNGDVVEYEGIARGRRLESPRLDREKMVQELEEELEEKGVEDASVKAEEEGVTVTLQNIQFPPDSAHLWESEKEKLRRIAEILQKYSERDILITGHTARAPGYTEQDFQSLSEKRAKAVGDYLLELGAVEDTHLVTRGMGAGKPLADNATESGRRLNRRVEITILEN